MSNVVRLKTGSSGPIPSPAPAARELESDRADALDRSAFEPGERLPPPETPPQADRRGPMRPPRLSPTRRRLQGEAYARAFQTIDGLLLTVVSLAGLLIEGGQAGLYLSPALAVMVALSLSGRYRFGSKEGLAYHLAITSLAVLGGALGAAAILASFMPISQIAAAIGAWTVAAFVGLYGLHAVWWLLVRRWRASGRLTPNVVVVGATPAAERLIAHALRSRELNVLGVFDDRLARAPSAMRGVPVLGDTQALLEHRIMPYVDRVIVAVPAGARHRVREVIEALRPLPNEIALLLEDDAPAGDDLAAKRASRARDIPLAHIAGPPRQAGRAIAKRSLDLVVGLLALVLALPLMVLLALAIRLDSPGPIFFRQRRQGFNNEEIVVWKFRSMRQEAADANAARQVQADDDRVTRVGRIIRATSLDELPQLLNVLKGEMSLVGPRPHAIGMMTGDVESARLVAEYAHRHRMKPGMTGWAAIHGSRGPVDTPEDVRRRVELDVEYIERQSLWLDLYIMAMTLPCLLGDRQAVR